MIEKLVAVVADVDGTLVEKGHLPHRATIDALERLHERKVLFGIATGRPYDRRMLARAWQWGLSFGFDFIIGMGGGDVFDAADGVVERQMRLSREAVRQVLSIVWPLDCNAIIYEDGYDHVLVKRMDDKMRASQQRNHSVVEVAGIERMCAFDAGKIEVQYDPALEDGMAAVIRAHRSPAWECCRSFPGTIEFMRPGLTKGRGLARLCERRGIPVGAVMAFGDMDSDIPLMETAGWGVCLAGGSEEAKAAADAVTDYPVELGGVGRYLFDCVLGSVV